jgi:hypothetical protein
MAGTVTTATSPLNCLWIEPGSRRSIDGFEYAVCQRVPDAERVVNEAECAHCPSWEPLRYQSKRPSVHGGTFVKSLSTVLFGTWVLAALTIAPAHGWQVSPDEHAAHHPAAQAAPASTPQPAPVPQAKGMKGMKGMDMKASNAKLDELVAKMNAAQGQAKVDAMAELLTTLVQHHQNMHGNMGEMMSKMKDGAAAK